MLWATFLIHMTKILRYTILSILCAACAQVCAVTTPQKKAEKLMRDSLKYDLREARLNTNDKSKPDFAVARRHLEHAFKNPYGKGNPDVTLQAAHTEYQCFQTERNRPASGGRMDEKVIYASTAAGFLYYSEAYQMLKHPAKGVPPASQKVLQQIRINAYDLFRSTQGFRATAGYYFRAKDWKNAHHYFKMALESIDSEMLKDYALVQAGVKEDFAKFRTDSIRKHLVYSCAVTAVQMGDHPLAIRELEVAKYSGIQPNRVRQQLCKEYLAIKDTVGYERTLEEGLGLLPDEPWYAESLLNLFLVRNEHQKALGIIDRVIENKPGNASTIELKGQLLDESGDVANAEVAFLQAIVFDTTLVVSYSSLGRILFNRAIAAENEMVEARRFDEIYDTVVPLYEKALPYYDRAYINDKERKDESIASAIRTILYKRFQSPKCRNAKQLIRRYNEVSRAYGMSTL